MWLFWGTIAVSIVCTVFAQQLDFTFSFTGYAQNFTVPIGINTIYVDMVGASCGVGGFGTPRYGARVQTTLYVDPGTVVHIYIGGQGNNFTENLMHDSKYNAGGWNGGGAAYGGGSGGGGGTDIRIGGFALSDRVVVAGGGGGYYGDPDCGNQIGGSGGFNGTAGTPAPDSSCPGYAYSPAGGGTQTKGGAAAGSGTTPAPTAGQLGVGGNGGNSGSGGGGGGYYGGGGGYDGGSGGGGSSHSKGYDTTYTDAYWLGDGRVNLTLIYAPSSAPSSIPTRKPTSLPTGSPSSRPSSLPSSRPTSRPTSEPSTQPSEKPSSKPTYKPAIAPTTQPTGQPSRQPTSHPSVTPSSSPTGTPTTVPTSKPSKPRELFVTYDFNTALISTLFSFLGAFLLYLTPTYVLTKWSHEYVFIYDEKAAQSLQPNQIGLLMKNDALIAYHCNGVERPEEITLTNDMITQSLHKHIVQQLQQKQPFPRNRVNDKYKYIYNINEISMLQEGEIGIMMQGNSCSLFCNTEKLTAYAMQGDGSAKCIDIPTTAKDSLNGIKPTLFHAIAAEYYSLRKYVFVKQEVCLLRDCLLVPGKLRPAITVCQKIFCLGIPIYYDLAFSRGPVYNFLTCNGRMKWIYTILSLNGFIPGFVYGVCLTFFKSRVSASLPRLEQESFDQVVRYIEEQCDEKQKLLTHNILHASSKDVENSQQNSRRVFDQASTSVDMVEGSYFK